jgi:hypothetical protein
MHTTCLLDPLTLVWRFGDAQYYEDETFYDAVIVRKSKTGWFVSFAGYEDEKPQDTDVSDILSVPAHGASAPPPSFHYEAGPMRGGSMAAPKGHDAISPGYHGSIPSSQFEQHGGALSGSGGQPQAPWLKKCRANRRCIIPNCPYTHPQGREIDDAHWEACEAICYADGLWYEAFTGPQTATGGYLVAFIGYEDDACQDTLETDIRTTMPGKGKKQRVPKEKAAQGYQGHTPLSPDAPESFERSNKNKLDNKARNIHDFIKMLSVAFVQLVSGKLMRLN